MWQFRARPVITAASTHLLLRTYGNTTHSSSQIHSLKQMRLPHTDAPLNIQFGPSAGIIPGSLCGRLQFTSCLCLSGTGKTLYMKEKACGGGSHWAVNELPPWGSFPQYLASKLTGRAPEKLSRVVSMWNQCNLTPSASRTRSQAEYTRSTDSWEEAPSSGSPNHLREAGKQCDWKTV